MRPYWKGYLKLALVACPIALYAACSTSERIAFRQINKTTGHRLRQQLIDEETCEPVPPEQKGRGYEIAKGQYLVVEDEELEAIQIESTRIIEIDSFASAGDRPEVLRHSLLCHPERAGRPGGLRCHPGGHAPQDHGGARAARACQARTGYRA
jgi:Ku protein